MPQLYSRIAGVEFSFRAYNFFRTASSLPLGVVRRRRPMAWPSTSFAVVYSVISIMAFWLRLASLARESDWSHLKASGKI
jgi:hypothetical protein